jgi:hypothetical protein
MASIKLSYSTSLNLSEKIRPFKLRKACGFVLWIACVCFDIFLVRKILVLKENREFI